MSVKKVIIVIVEGYSDQVSLERILSEIFKDKTILFKIIRGDILTDSETNSINLIDKINEKITECMDKNFFEIEDIERVIHIVDTDGVFINNNNVIFEDKEGTSYNGQFIKTRNVANIIRRNLKKSGFLNILIALKEIRDKLPYNVYYFSCNLEHVLHKEQNADDAMKKELSNKFENLYYYYPQFFIPFINDTEIAVRGSYKATWDFIKKDNNSLKRYSNFHLFVNR
ncbi:MAG: hypothetical protein PHD15_00520 [Clostridia bacterium]|nr:hypothetical protein [Clostridia bacterium]MDD4386235.1 hypothetical protein [Clostridia bacterium]